MIELDWWAHRALQRAIRWTNYPPNQGSPDSWYLQMCNGYLVGELIGAAKQAIKLNYSRDLVTRVTRVTRVTSCSELDNSHCALIPGISSDSPQWPGEEYSWGKLRNEGMRRFTTFSHQGTVLLANVQRLRKFGCTLSDSTVPESFALEITKFSSLSLLKNNSQGIGDNIIALCTEVVWYFMYCPTSITKFELLLKLKAHLLHWRFNLSSTSSKIRSELTSFSTIKRPSLIPN